MKTAIVLVLFFALVVMAFAADQKETNEKDKELIREKRFLFEKKFGTRPSTDIFRRTYYYPRTYYDYPRVYRSQYALYNPYRTSLPRFKRSADEEEDERPKRDLLKLLKKKLNKFDSTAYNYRTYPRYDYYPTRYNSYNYPRRHSYYRHQYPRRYSYYGQEYPRRYTTLY